VGRFSICQSIDDLSESCQRLINLLRLFKSLAFSACFGNLLRASQIDKVKLSNLAGHVDGVVLGHRQNEHGVGTGGLCVHIGGTSGSVLVARTHQFIDLLLTFDVHLAHVLKVDAFANLFVDS